MGVLDEIFGGGAKILKFNGQSGSFVARDSDQPLNNAEMVVDVLGARGGFIKFGASGQAPERHLGSIFPKDESPARGTLGNLDKGEWPTGRFSQEPEDPWVMLIEIPMTNKMSGESFVFAAQTRGSLAAAKDFLVAARKLPEGYNPVVKLSVGGFKGKYGQVKRPVLAIVGKMEVEGGAEESALDDEVPF
jgi:hypothetical protein